MRQCPYCNSELPERAKFCMECGKKLSEGDHSRDHRDNAPADQPAGTSDHQGNYLKQNQRNRVKLKRPAETMRFDPFNYFSRSEISSVKILRRRLQIPIPPCQMLMVIKG